MTKRLTTLTLIALTAAMLMAGCNFRQDDSSQQRGMRMVEIARDSMSYGICLDVRGSDSLLFLTDQGDTLWHSLSPDVSVIGKITPGEQLAIMLTPTSRRQEVSVVVNTSMLVGEWVEADPIAEGNVKGYQIGNGGAAEGINLTDVTIEGWSIYNGKLLITGSFGVEQFTDTFTIRRLTADTLRLASGNVDAHIMHRLRPGEANYENANYDYEADPTSGKDFNPESEDVEVSPEMLDGGPVY